MFRRLLKNIKTFAQNLVNNVVDGLIDCVTDYTEILVASLVVAPVLGTGPLAMLVTGSIIARTVFSNNGDRNGTRYANSSYNRRASNSTSS